MIKIRKSVFETNSSSIHSIAIPKSCEDYKKFLQTTIYFGFDDFGWEIESVNPANYLYTAIHAYYAGDKDSITNWINILKEELDKAGISYEFSKAVYGSYTWDGKEYSYLNSGNIDHPEDLGNLFEYFLNHRDKIVPFLLDGMVFTGNDNISEDEEGSNDRDKEFIEVFHYNKGKSTIETIRNPYYEKENDNYDLIYKGN